MSITSVRRIIFCALLGVALVGLSAQLTLAQDSTQSQRVPASEDQTNLDLELYVIAATNQQPREGKMPASLDPVMKQLRETLAFKNYSLATTLVNLVKNGGNLSLNWIVSPNSNPPSSASATPTFNQFSITQLKIAPDGNGRQVIQMLRFSFGSRIPIQTGTNIAASGTNSAPVFVYEHVGLVTDISVHEGQPAVIGTLNIGPSGEAIVLAVLAKRAVN